MKMRAFWDIVSCSLVGVDRRFRRAYHLHQPEDVGMWTVSTSETSVYSNKTTRHYMPEGSHLHTRRRKNAKISRQVLRFLLGKDRILK
jgi:hypothetical protein